MTWRGVCLHASALAGAGIMIAGCQLVAGYESRRLDPLVAGCTLPEPGDRRMRIANLVPSDEKIDVCLRPAGGAYARPLFRGGGVDCPAGLAYASVSAPFGAPSGKVDVKVIPGGSPCSVAALSETKDVEVSAQTPVSLLRIGGGGERERLVVAREPSERHATLGKMRFTNASPGGPPVVFGLAKLGRLPTEIASKLVDTPIPFGGSFPPGPGTTQFTVDGSGSLLMPSKIPLVIGAAAGSTSNAVFAGAYDDLSGIRATYVIGLPGSSQYPIRALVCDDGNVTKTTTTCKQTDLATMGFDAWNVDLQGLQPIEEAARRPAIMKAVSERLTDVMCLTFAFRKEDRAALAQAAATAGLKYSYTPDLVETTPFSDTTDLNGTPVPAQTAPPCAPPIDQKPVDEVVQCLAQNCSSQPGDVNGVMTSVQCATSKCVSALLPLFTGSQPERRCAACVNNKFLDGTTIKGAADYCTQTPHQVLAFDGQAGAIIVSRYPLRDTEALVLPSTNLRQQALYARLELEAGTSVDYYCASLSSPIGRIVAYPGDWSGGDDGNGWPNEQRLQVDKIIAWVKKKSGNRPAVVSGDWQAGAELLKGGQQVLAPLSPDVIADLRAAFQPAVPGGDWEPACTYCPPALNPLNTQNAGSVTVGTFLSSYPSSGAETASVFANEASAQFSTGTPGPMSRFYGQQVRLIHP